MEIVVITVVGLISLCGHWWQLRNRHKLSLEIITLTSKAAQNTAIFEEKIRLLELAKTQLTDAFKALSADALQQNNQSFLTLANSILEKFHVQAQGNLKEREVSIQNLVDPLKNTLGVMQTKLDDLEKARVGAYEGLKQQVASMIETQNHLREETVNLGRALRSPNVRGRWGEMQLRRVVELAGLNEHCDFDEQPHLTQTEENSVRPDMVVHLPGKKSLIIDAKVPCSAYLSAIESRDEKERLMHMRQHAQHVRDHVERLSKKEYWRLRDSINTPEFTILFLPGDTFLSAALDVDPHIIEDSIQKRIIIATPATLIALLHAVAYSWRQEALTENARHISDLGAELYKRVGDMTAHMQKLGNHLDTAVHSYNQTVGSLEKRVLPTARRFKELRVVSGHDDIESLAPLAASTRPLVAPELQEKNGHNVENLLSSENNKEAS